MLVARTLDELRAARASFGGRTLGLVPTMGALHAGHQALVQAAVAAGGAVAASIFVNPLQFGPNEDLSRYPRDEAADLVKLQEAGCDLAWLPDVATMYPPGNATTVEVAGPALHWEGAQRPGHFRGVATVVARLFGQVRPDHAYFGEKDWQQVQVVARMVTDLLLPVQVVPVPTVRDDDGLALSSRNRFLSPEERLLAAVLPTVLRTACARLPAEGLPALDAARQALEQAGFTVDYLALVDAASLETLTEPRPGSRVLAAARLGTVRLLDNMAVG
ncbi:MAG TPA: pantoate--beta-alanine ligase [Acetobacteraceae bacterium]